MRTANPALNSKTFEYSAGTVDRSSAMTIQGTVNKTFILLFCVVITAAWIWQKFNHEPMQSVYPWMIAGLIGGLVAAIVTISVKKIVAITAPIYAVFEGLVLGGISAIFEVRYPGIVVQAVGLTFGTLFALLMAYKSGLIKATENFKLGVVAATGAICLIYIVSMVLGFFSIHVPFVHESGWFGIGFSLFVVVIAALNLVLDFDFIENGAQQGAPKYMEWYGAFGLLVTLIWLYLEILRLLSKLRDRR